MANVKELVDRGVELYNQGKLDEWSTMWAEDIEFTSPMSGPLKGREAVKGFFARGRDSFPDAKASIQKIVAEGDTFVIEYVWTGTNSGPTTMPTGQTVPATNKKMSLPAIDISTVDPNGKVKSLRQYFDVAGAMMQVGLMPEPARA